MNRWIIVSLLALSASCALAAPKPITKNPELERITDAFRREASSALLLDANGQHLGSGVFVAATTNGLLVVSNRHVVGAKKVVCVVTSDHSAIAGMVVTEQKGSRKKELDIALIWMPLTLEVPTRIAEIAEKVPSGNDLHRVVATGYPTFLNTSKGSPVYSERPGLLIPLLKTPLQDGIDLAYTAAIQKGMSGGGLFLGSKLIGINSAHSEPLWPGHWQDESGLEVNNKLNQKLELVSLGISSQVINKKIKSYKPPTDPEINRLNDTRCDNHV